MCEIAGTHRGLFGLFGLRGGWVGIFIHRIVNHIPDAIQSQHYSKVVFTAHKGSSIPFGLGLGRFPRLLETVASIGSQVRGLSSQRSTVGGVYLL